jgi:putative alpha-1,2-mannosidase
VLFNGKAYQKNFISYANIMKGGVLKVYLQQQPSNWGADVKARAGSRF